MNCFNRKFIAAAIIGSILCLPGCHSTTITEFETPITDAEGCATALPVAFQNGVFLHTGEISDLSGVAYFVLNSPAPGDWLLLETRNDELMLPTFDPVVSIYAMNGTTRYAAMDDGWSGLSRDSFFYYHISSAESLCIKVESYDRWTDSLSPGEGAGESLNYTLRLAQNEQNLSTYETASQDADNDSASGSVAVQMHEQDAASGLSMGWILGELSSLTDGDRYRFVSSPVESIAELNVNLDGGNGNPENAASGTGSTAKIAIQILDDTETVVAELVPGAQTSTLSFLPQPSTAYYIRVIGAPDWQPGINDFYSVRVLSEWLDEYPMEPDAANDTMESASEVSLMYTEDGGQRGAVLGQLTPDGDVDFYRIALVMGENLAVFCAGASLGSGLENFTLSALDDTGAAVVEQTEGDRPIDWSDNPAATGGILISDRDETVYFRISAFFPAQPASRFYYCYFEISPTK